MRIGVLALQGDYDAHRRVLERLGAACVFVRKPEALDQVDALIIPGGESTALLTFLQEHDFFGKLKNFARSKPTFGTCAGAILLAKEVVGPEQPSLDVLDVRIRRNAYGRQIESSIRQGTLTGKPLEMVFIRAPKFERVGKKVEVLARERGDPVLVRENNVLAATFHPEMTDNTRVHETFLELVRSKDTQATEAHEQFP